MQDKITESAIEKFTIELLENRAINTSTPPTLSSRYLLIYK